MLMLSIALKKCVAQTVPVDKTVLNYLFQQSAKAYYLEKDLKLTDSIIVAQNGVITYKDSIIIGQSEGIAICDSRNEICEMQLKSSQNENKKANRKVKFFKFTTITALILGAISSTYALLH